MMLWKISFSFPPQRGWPGVISGCKAVRFTEGRAATFLPLSSKRAGHCRKRQRAASVTGPRMKWHGYTCNLGGTTGFSPSH